MVTKEQVDFFRKTDTSSNVTEHQRRAFVIIFMAQGVCYNNAQSPGHVLVPTIEVEDGEPIVGDSFPVA